MLTWLRLWRTRIAFVDAMAREYFNFSRRYNPTAIQRAADAHRDALWEARE